MILAKLNKSGTQNSSILGQKKYHIILVYKDFLMLWKPDDGIQVEVGINPDDGFYITNRFCETS